MTRTISVVGSVQGDAILFHYTKAGGYYTVTGIRKRFKSKAEAREYSEKRI